MGRVVRRQDAIDETGQTGADREDVGRRRIIDAYAEAIRAGDFLEW